MVDTATFGRAYYGASSLERFECAGVTDYGVLVRSSCQLPMGLSILLKGIIFVHIYFRLLWKFDCFLSFQSSPP